MSYSDLLRDPRWQRKRLEVLQSADWKCQECNGKKRTLNVHHRIYRKGRKPWEYQEGELTCLCEDCHKTETVTLDQINQEIFNLCSIIGSEEALCELRDFIDNLIFGQDRQR